MRAEDNRTYVSNGKTSASFVRAVGRDDVYDRRTRQFGPSGGYDDTPPPARAAVHAVRRTAFEPPPTSSCRGRADVQQANCYTLSRRPTIWCALAPRPWCVWSPVGGFYTRTGNSRLVRHGGLTGSGFIIFIARVSRDRAKT